MVKDIILSRKRTNACIISFILSSDTKCCSVYHSLMHISITLYENLSLKLLVFGKAKFNTLQRPCIYRNTIFRQMSYICDKNKVHSAYFLWQCNLDFIYLDLILLDHIICKEKEILRASDKLYSFFKFF